MLNQLQHCEEYGIPLAIVLGESELQKGLVKLRDIMTRQEVEVPRDQMIQSIKEKLKSLQNQTPMLNGRA